MYTQRLRTARQDGNVLFELILIIPFLIYLALTVVELTRVMRYYKMAQVFSREIANEVYRECSDPDFALTRNCLKISVQKLEQDFVDSIVPGTQIIVSLYEPNSSGDFELAERPKVSGGTNYVLRAGHHGDLYPDASTDYSQIACASGLTCTGGDAAQSRVNSANGPSISLPANLAYPDKLSLNYHADFEASAPLHTRRSYIPKRVVVVGEVYVPYKPLVGYVSKMFGYIPSGEQTNGAFYDATIL
jgi:hypothetical protein